VSNNDAQRRHDIIVRFFRGEFGEDIYGNVVLAGSRGREITVMRAYVGLYPDRRLYFAPLAATRLTQQSAQMRIKRLTMHPDDIANQYTQVKALKPGGSTEALAETLWKAAGVRTTPLGLPLAFVTFQATGDGSQKTVFWYSRMAPGDWLLKQIQNRIR